MAMINSKSNACPACGHAVGPEDGFCAACGRRLRPEPPPLDFSPGRSAAWFFGTLAVTLALSLVLMMVFHLPVFILGAFLPWVWWSRRRG